MEAIRQSIDRLAQRLTAMDSRIDQRFTTIDGQLAALRAEMSGQFRCIVGIHVTVFVALAGTLSRGSSRLQ